MGTLYLIATPIGNLEDLSQRTLRVLGELDALACEDTRVTRRIYERFGINSPRTIFAYHDHNQEQAGRRILGLLAEGLQVGLCSDGGYPGISDPGYRIIAACHEHGHTLDVIPGPSAVPVALLLSGLPTSSYTFKGFPPRKPGARKRFLALEEKSPHTLVLFESPFRIGKLLLEAFEVLGDRPAAVCLELTKKFQRVERGSLETLSAQYTAKRIKGEATIVIGGCPSKKGRLVAELEEPSEAAKELSEEE
jgi:16S rRNA (cytidine1402-2'-O)-methyltransferase